MVSYYPEVLQQKEFIEKVIRTEEERFNETINEGLEILNQVIQEVKRKRDDSSRKRHLQTIRHIWLPGRINGRGGRR